MIIKDIELTNMDGKVFEMEIYLNTSTVMQIEKGLKKIDPKYTFYNTLSLLDKDATVDVIYFCGILHKKGNFRAMPDTFFDENKIDYFKYRKEIAQKFAECLIDMNPTTKVEGGK